jgi:hypothetical protein
VNVLQDTDNWLDQMMALGWVVVSTDYVGLGTPGINNYLVAQDEARDVVNSVRAAQAFPGTDAGSAGSCGVTPRAGTPRCGPGTSPPGWLRN